MKRFLLATTAVAVPLAAASMAFGQASTTPTSGAAAPNTNRTVFVQAGSTRRVTLGRVNAGTGYAWRWITKPKATVAKGLAVRTTRAVRPGAPTVAFTRIVGLAEDLRTTGQLGLFGPGASTPTRTISLRITVTGDGR